VPLPPSTKKESSTRNREGRISQKLKAFIRGKDISSAPIKRGSIQLPKPPTKLGITTKKIITKPCKVITLLYNCPEAKNLPGADNSNRMIKESPVPTRPLQREK
jgi:hypothetical protein